MFQITTNKQRKKETTKFHFNNTLLLLHRFDVYIYTNFIYAIYFKVDIKYLMNRNENIKFKKRIMSE